MFRVAGEPRFIIKRYKESSGDDVTAAMREATLLDACRTSSHIPLLLDMFLNKSRHPCLVLEFCQLGPLHDIFLKRDAMPFQPRELRDVVAQTAAGLAHIHRYRMTHGDVKIDNILAHPWPEPASGRRGAGNEEEWAEWDRAGGHAFLIKLTDGSRAMMAALRDDN